MTEAHPGTVIDCGNPQEGRAKPTLEKLMPKKRAAVYVVMVRVIRHWIIPMLDDKGTQAEFETELEAVKCAEKLRADKSKEYADVVVMREA